MKMIVFSTNSSACGQEMTSESFTVAMIADTQPLLLTQLLNPDTDIRTLLQARLDGIVS